MEFLDEKLAKYIEEHTDAEPLHLQKLNRETQLKVLMPRMISGHFQGRVLSMLMKMIKPKRILEIGTYTGYSALCMVEGLEQGGELITIDINAELEEMVQSHFDVSEYAKNIKYIIGDAKKIIPTVDGKFDVVFIDADKENYALYYDLIFDKLSIGGYMIADNVLWSGKVVAEGIKIDKDTKALLDFNDKVQADSRVENVLFPIRDGLLIARKIS
jgi:predicted O-methyltransferase YrrM